MKKETKENEGPACACGKGDLYEEWLKAENKKKEDSEASASGQVEVSVNPSNSTDK
jgi:hypothetical protein